MLAPVLDLRERIPAVQARALGTALALEAPAPYDPFAVPAAVFSLLGTAAEDGPVLVVVDDLQWLDEGSVRAIVFAARRLDAEGVVVLLGARSGELEGLDVAGDRAGRAGRLDAEAARALLRDRAPGLSTEVGRAAARHRRRQPARAARAACRAHGRPAQRHRAARARLPRRSSVEQAFVRRHAELPERAARALAVVAAMESGWLERRARRDA